MGGVGDLPAGTSSASVARLRASFESGVTRPLAWRREQLRALLQLLSDGEQELLDALAADLGKPATEGLLTDVRFTAAEVKVLLDGLDRWAAPQVVRVPLVQRPGRARVLREPLGVVLVIAPWNYPVALSLAPMAAAIAAGNCVLGKPSEMAPATAAALAGLVRRHLDEGAATVLRGGVPETQELLAQRFDHIFYTGNGRVARVVMAAAARDLTPVTLELGGKSPAVVDRGADIEVAARRITWGKFLNAGQTCVAPDYVLAHRDVRDRLVAGITSSIHRFYGPDPQASPDYGRIVNDAHWRRLTALLGAGGARLATGGQADRATRYLAPTVLVDVDPASDVMAEEIFGPILPVLTVEDLDEATDFIRRRPKPLALYVFAASPGRIQEVVDHTSSGGVCVNGTVQHLAVPGLPFGGVGESGSGAYHGRYGFETFSHRRAVLARRPRPDLPFAYPPYTPLRRWILRRAL